MTLFSRKKVPPPPLEARLNVGQSVSLDDGPFGSRDLGYGGMPNSNVFCLNVIGLYEGSSCNYFPLSKKEVIIRNHILEILDVNADQIYFRERKD